MGNSSGILRVNLEERGKCLTGKRGNGDEGAPGGEKVRLNLASSEVSSVKYLDMSRNFSRGYCGRRREVLQ